MNMQALMAQAKKLQNTLEKTTKEIEEKEFVYENDNIKLVMLGNNSLKSIKIKNSSLSIDLELLEDVIVVGINDLSKQIRNEKDSKLGKYTNGLGGLF